MASNNTVQHTNVATNVNGANLNVFVPPEIPQPSLKRMKRKNPYSELVEEQRPSRHLNTRLEQVYQFNFELPEGYVSYMTDEVSKLASLGHKDWLPLAERLSGWIREVRVRINNTTHRDNFFYHGHKKFRTAQDVKRFIYLGYPPRKEFADEPLERWALNQPDPKLVKIYGPRYPHAPNTDSQAGPSTHSISQAAGPSTHSLVGDQCAGVSS